jgi:NAD/NADP transhydrogenase beta subunit
MRTGFSGIENEIRYDQKTKLLFWDSKDSLNKVVSSLKNL